MSSQNANVEGKEEKFYNFTNSNKYILCIFRLFHTFIASHKNNGKIFVWKRGNYFKINLRMFVKPFLRFYTKHFKIMMLWIHGFFFMKLSYKTKKQHDVLFILNLYNLPD